MDKPKSWYCRICAAPLRWEPDDHRWVIRIGHPRYQVYSGISYQIREEWDEDIGIDLCRQWCELVHSDLVLASMRGMTQVTVRSTIAEDGTRSYHLVVPE